MTYSLHNLAAGLHISATDFPIPVAVLGISATKLTISVADLTISIAGFHIPATKITIPAAGLGISVTDFTNPAAGLTISVADLTISADHQAMVLVLKRRKTSVFHLFEIYKPIYNSVSDNMVSVVFLTTTCFFEMNTIDLLPVM